MILLLFKDELELVQKKNILSDTAIDWNGVERENIVFYTMYSIQL